MTEAQVQDIIRWMLINQQGFAWRDLLGQDRWQYRTEADVGYTTQFTTTNVGTPTYKMRWRVVGKQCFFQATIDSGTTIATTAGISYMVLPIVSRDISGNVLPVGLTGMGTMTNGVTNIAIGVCHINVTLGRCYLPTQAAIADELHIAGWYEVN